MAHPRAIEYRLLGPVEVVVDGTPHPVPGEQRQLLLAALLLAGRRGVPTDQLVELLWEDRPPPHPERALRSHVARVRRAVGADAPELRFRGGAYALATTAPVDARRFEELARVAHGDGDDVRSLEAADAGLQLWRGGDLAFSHRRVLQAAATRLLELRAALVERRAELLLRRGTGSDSVAELHELLVARPEREGCRALLMEALARAGRPTEALEVYASWESALRERGLVPAPRLRELERRILRHDLADPRPASPTHDRARARGVGGGGEVTTSFVGRERDLEVLLGALDEHRLVTLVGPGGVGKTRLAREVLRRVDARVGSVLDVDLSAVEDPTDVAPLVAIAAGVEHAAGRGLVDQIVERLAGGTHLLLLDNCEHVVGEAGSLVAAVRAGATGVTVLATSQIRLSVPGEWTWAVSPLPSDAPDAPAVRLFLDRARAQRPLTPGPVLGDGDAERVQRICAAVDGLPLGIEIAAAQTAALTLADLESEIEHRLELRASSHAGPARHRSLRDVVAWSFERLGEREQRALERLSTFVGPFDLAAARSMLAGVVPEREVAACIVELVGRSLLASDVRSRHGSYRTFQGVRALALERLDDGGLLLDAHARHAAWAVELAEGASARLADDEHGVVQQLDRSLDDLRSAHRWMAVHDVHGAMRLIHALHPFACWHGRTEIFRWAEELAAAVSSSPLLASLHASVCAGAWIRGDLAAAEHAARAALAAVTDPTSPIARRAFEQAAEVALQRGDAGTAVAMYDRALELSVLAGDVMQATWDLGSSALILHYTGEVEEGDLRAVDAGVAADRLASPSARSFAAFVRGELMATRAPREARRHLERAVQLAEEVDNQFLGGLARVTLASVVPDVEQLAASIDHYRAALAGWERTGAWFAQLVTLRNVVGLLASNGGFQDAATLYGVVMGARAAGTVYGADRAKLERTRAALVRELGEEEVVRLAAAGDRLRPNEVTSFALAALDRLRR